MFFWKAFLALSKARRPSFGGISDILIADILAYAELVGVRDLDLRSQLCRIVVAMDAAVLEWHRNNTPTEPKV